MYEFLIGQTGIRQELAIVAPGAFTPLVILSLVRQGVDCFDSSLCTLAAERNCALVFPFQQSMVMRYIQLIYLTIQYTFSL